MKMAAAHKKWITVLAVLVAFSCIMHTGEAVPIFGNKANPGGFMARLISTTSSDPIKLTPAELGAGESLWVNSWNKNLKQETLINNIVKDLFNMGTRMFGWFMLDLALYGTSNLQ